MALFLVPTGSSGRLTVKLSQPIRVSSISIEHAPRVLLLNEGSSALKVFSVIGERGGLFIPAMTGFVMVIILKPSHGSVLGLMVGWWLKYHGNVPYEMKEYVLFRRYSSTGYPRGWVTGPDTVGHSLVSDAEYRLDGDEIQFFNISEEYRG